MLKFEFAIEAIITFGKNIKKGIKWYVHFIGKSIIWTAKYIPTFDPSKYIRASDFQSNELPTKLVWPPFIKSYIPWSITYNPCIGGIDVWAVHHKKRYVKKTNITS